MCLGTIFILFFFGNFRPSQNGSVKGLISFLSMTRPAPPEPRGEIVGAPDLYVQKGSLINLTCVLHDLPEPPQYVRWYHTNHRYHNRVTLHLVTFLVEMHDFIRQSSLVS